MGVEDFLHCFTGTEDDPDLWDLAMYWPPKEEICKAMKLRTVMNVNNRFDFGLDQP
jgi:hypothetical protein